MKQIVFSIAVVLAFASSAMAQTVSSSNTSSASGVGLTLAVKAPQADPARHGFTALANIGFGIQKDEFYGQTSNGLAGLNFGVGYFVHEKIAVLFRFSGTRGTFDFDDGVTIQQVDQMSGVFGGTLQMWVHPRVAIEAGAGLGRWADDVNSDNGLGIIVGVTAVVFRRGSHNVTVGAEYAPVFVDSGNIHNIGIVGGYQFIMRR